MLLKWQKTPENRTVAIAIASAVAIALIFAIELYISRNRTLEEGNNRLQHFGLMMAEHTSRTFGVVNVLLRAMAQDLSEKHRNWQDWDASQGWEYLAQRQSRALPQLRNLVLMDRNGKQRFVSSHFQPRQEYFNDRPYFKALQSGADSITSGPFVGRNIPQYTYGLTHRLKDEQNLFAGVVFAAMEPAYFQEFCWPNRLTEDFEAFLTNAQGEIVASCRPADLSRQSKILGARVGDVVYDGKFKDHVMGKGLRTENGFRLLELTVPEFSDLRIFAAIPEDSLLGSWRTHLVELSLLWLALISLLFIGTWLILRQFKAMHEAHAEMQRAHVELANSRQQQDERVSNATSELSKQKEAAERANTAKSRFLAAASHDLRQPLHALGLFVTDLQHQVQNGEFSDLPRLTEQISVTTRTLGELLNSLLDISRLDVEGVRPEIRKFPLMPLFDRLSPVFRRAIDEAQLSLLFRPSNYWLESDPALLEQMLSNLIANAIRYTPKGGRILVVARRQGEKIRLEVRDNGLGISEEHQQAIFSEFYQVNNRARESDKGLGLGLSIVERLASALDIPVRLRSRIGEGSTFSLLVTRATPVSTAHALPPASAQQIHVHCIGNSEDLQECRGLIIRWDYHVTHAETFEGQRLPSNALLLVDAEVAVDVRNQLLPDTPLIVLNRGENFPIPADAHSLPTPTRPAKLRALLAQLQKTLSRTNP